ncbi:MAG: riboflavin synthase [Nanoarchaeota archaeon]|nr:riboflavin synthase [Nanoarchaeota archaeon]MBU1004193.1 riboflavin synthase [Nanoarchaeota archaeon]MBU1945355.1 riboflavin synthase [Nanoarchaeota archaeon]
MSKKIGIADTMFARVNMFEIVQKALDDSMEPGIKLERYTVPGVKDLPVACKKLLEEHNCDICIALGMPGDKPIDKVCAHEASQGLIQTQLLTNKHIIEVFVHLDEGKSEKELYEIVKNRTYDHTMNTIALLKGKNELSKKAGKGIRQGKESMGAIK